jgi:hypothetical protein
MTSFERPRLDFLLPFIRFLYSFCFYSLFCATTRVVFVVFYTTQRIILFLANLKARP